MQWSPVKLNLNIQKIDVAIQKINDLPLITNEMILIGLSVQNKIRKVWFFEQTFLLADTSIEVVLKMSFLMFSNADTQFKKKELEWKSYIIAEALPINKKVER